MNSAAQKKGNYWIITTEYPPLFGGGIGTYCFHNAQMLNQNDWNVSVFIPSRTRHRDTVHHINNIRIIEFCVNRSGKMDFLGYDTALVFDFASILEEYLKSDGVPDLVESQEYAGIAYGILLYKHLGYDLFAQLRVLITIHAPSFLYNEYNKSPSYQLPYFWISEMEKWCIKAADVLNAPSNFIQEAIRDFFSTPLTKKIHRIPYPYQVPSINILYDKDPRHQWFFIGKLTPQKGILALLQAFRNLWNEGWYQQLLLIGGGDHYYHPENVSMQDWITSRYAREIHEGLLVLSGNLSPQSWKEKTETGCVVLIPSLGDNYPFTVIESLNNGQIVLASKQGGQCELIEHGVNGFLFDHKISGDLESKIREISRATPEQLLEIRQSAVNTIANKHSYINVYPYKETLINEINTYKENTNFFPFTRDFSVDEMKLKESEKNEKGLLSVVIPYYNMGDYIEQTLRSIYDSEYTKLEVIIVNDGSDEHHTKKINQFQSKYHFKLISQQNQGLAKTRNAGASHANGEFLAFIDADDKIHPAFYKKAIELLQEKENVFFIGSWVQYFQDSKNIWPSFTPEPPYLLYYNMVCGGGLVYRTSAFLQYGQNDPLLEYGLEDWESVISLVENGCRGVVLPEPLYLYRIRKGSMARMFTREKILYSIKYITSKHLSIYSTFAADLNGLLLANGPGYKISNPTLDKERFGWLVNHLPFMRKTLEFAKRNPTVRKIIFKLKSFTKK
ncbi:MAG: glycosyltransferase [Bacteroidetes bacterium]|nr:glycosyltransferase [Bacteroidota bacterium]